MYEAKQTRQTESTQKQTVGTQNSSRAKQPLQRTVDAMNNPSYTQVWGNRLPAWLRLSASPSPIETMHQQKDAPDEVIRQAAHEGVRTLASTLSFAQLIQQSFGRHDISQIQAHLGPIAIASAKSMQASAYATGDHVVFAGTPNLHTAAHEAAHVVQQRGGVQLAGGIGKVGDLYEQHADAVADRVVAGQSAEVLLDRFAGGKDEAQGPVRNSGGHNPCSLSTFPIQGYFKLKKDFRVERQKDKQQMFTPQAESPTAQITPEGIKMDRKIRTFSPKDVNLLVSDDRTMAIHDTEQEPKEFYATERVVTNSNTELEKVESAFRLDIKTDNQIQIGNILTMVKPVNYKAASSGADAAKDEGFVSLIRHICIEMTGVLVGTEGSSNYEIVLSDPETRQTYTEEINPMGQKEEKVDRLTAFLAGSPENLKREKVQEVLNREEEPRGDYAKNYGTKSGKGKLNRAGEALSINAYARPEVGRDLLLSLNEWSANPRVIIQCLEGVPPRFAKIPGGIISQELLLNPLMVAT